MLNDTTDTIAVLKNNIYAQTQHKALAKCIMRATFTLRISTAS